MSVIPDFFSIIIIVMDEEVPNSALLKKIVNKYFPKYHHQMQENFLHLVAVFCEVIINHDYCYYHFRFIATFGTDKTGSEDFICINEEETKLLKGVGKEFLLFRKIFNDCFWHK